MGRRWGFPRVSRIDIGQGKDTVSEIIVMNVAQIVNSVVKGAVPCHRGAPLSFENTTISARPAPTSGLWIETRGIRYNWYPIMK
jgi:hypothetical protein